MMEEKINELIELIKESENIVFFGGAGVSTESGIPDFRSSEGIYSQSFHKRYNPEEVLSIDFFKKHPEIFYDFVREKLIMKDIKANISHYALKRLEDIGKVKAVITQNIDGLHQKAGSKKVIELHGNINSAYCVNCGKTFNEKYILSQKSNVLCDHCKAQVKPDIVLYGEYLDEKKLSESINYIKNCNLLIVGGTSLVVYPAAGLIRYLRNGKLCIINKDITEYDDVADIVLNVKLSEVFKKVVDELGL